MRSRISLLLVATSAAVLLASTVLSAQDLDRIIVTSDFNDSKDIGFRLINNSNRTITGYAIAIKVTLADGHTETLGTGADVGAFRGQEERGIKPGATKVFTNPKNGEVTEVQAKVVAVIYDDLTSEATDEDELTHLIQERVQMAKRMWQQGIDNERADKMAAYSLVQRKHPTSTAPRSRIVPEGRSTCCHVQQL